jgi:NADH-quinone oxidoreductase subunit M
MILVWLIIIPLAGGLLAWHAGRLRPVWARWISLLTLTVMFGLVLKLFAQNSAGVNGPHMSGPWLAEIGWEWIPQIGAGFHLAVDGLSLLLLLLTVFLGIAAVVSSWTEIEERAGFFHLNLLWILAGIIGVFLAIDLFLFYVFWELMLVPMYFLIALWGHENRRYAAFKFFLFTQAGGLLMLIAILGLFFVHGRESGQYTFDYMLLLGTSMKPMTEFLLMSGFFIAFAVKLPVVPLHTWLPDAHTEAPTAGSVILAGLLLKTGAYGLLRFVVPLFPHATSEFALAAMIIAVAGILYGAVMAFAQTDLKRLVAYTSISHMGFVLLGIFVRSETALQGALMQIICHGIATGALFIIAGAIQERTRTREIGSMGGLWETAPRMGGVGLFFALASLGLPGLGNFVGEFLVLLGSYRVNVWIAAVAAAGVVTATVYSLRIVQRVFHGPNKNNWRVRDLSVREMAVMTVMMAALLWLGLFPQQVFNTSRQAIGNLRSAAASPEPKDQLLVIEGSGRTGLVPPRGLK